MKVTQNPLKNKTVQLANVMAWVSHYRGCRLVAIDTIAGIVLFELGAPHRTPAHTHVFNASAGDTHRNWQILDSTFQSLLLPHTNRV